MPDRSYVGIDWNKNNEWIVASWCHGSIVFSQPFKNTPSGLAALVRFVSDQCLRPKICLNPTRPAALRLVKSVGGIPGAEVLLLSEAGLRMHQAWLPKLADAACSQAGTAHAFLLARCAERIV